MRNKFTIGVLLYGDYPQLAERCLKSIVNTIDKDHLHLRVGMNQVSPQVADWVKSWVPDDCIWESDENIHKYPMMRQMIHGIKPVETPYFMWFDDDSYLDGYQLTDRRTQQPYWLQTVEHAMVNSDMIGAIYSLGWMGHQREWVKSQPWYQGKDPLTRGALRFATGGWWTMRTEMLYRWNYPFPSLDHRGGDTMLGELCLQNDLRLNNFRTGVKINADMQGRESNAAKRGFDQPPCGAKFEPGVADVLHRATGSPAANAQSTVTPPQTIIEL
jgi:hypothetical protein